MMSTIAERFSLLVFYSSQSDSDLHEHLSGRAAVQAHRFSDLGAFPETRSLTAKQIAGQRAVKAHLAHFLLCSTSGLCLWVMDAPGSPQAEGTSNFD